MRLKIVVFLILIILLKAVLSFPFLSMPLARDEGVYGYLAQRILAGELPYRDVFDHKPPVVYYLYLPVVFFFGPSVLAIRLLALFFCLGTTFLLFLIARRLWGDVLGLAASLLYALFSGGILIQGSSANTETFLVFFATLALYLFIVSKKQKNLLWAGFFSGLAFMTKAVALFNFIPLFLFALFGKKHFDLKGLFWLLGGGLFVPLLCLLYFTVNGALFEFVRDAFLVNSQYLAISPVPGFFKDPTYGLDRIFWIARRENSILWVGGLLGLALCFLPSAQRNERLVAWWGIGSFVGVCLGPLFFGHYFIQLIPALCLLTVAALYRVKKWKPVYQIVGVLLCALLLVPICRFQYPVYFCYDPARISQIQYGTKNFVLSSKVCRDLAVKMQPSEKIFVWAAQPEIYFYLQKKAISPYIYYFRWMGKEKKEECLKYFYRAKPEYFVRTSYAPKDEKVVQFVRNYYKIEKKYADWDLYKRKGL